MQFARLLPLAAGWILMTGPLTGQVGSGVLTGRVLDESGSAIVDAGVKVLAQESGAVQSLRTNQEGLFRATALLPGVWSAEVHATGFDPQVRKNLTVEVAQTLAVDFVLRVGKSTQAIDVTADILQLETQSSSVGQLVNHKMIDNLPVGNRAATSLVNLSPGVVMISSGEGAENYPIFSVAGGRARNQDFTLDGGNVTNAVGVTRPQQQTSLPLDAMEEFRVISNNYSAEYGHSTGGIIALSTRSGTNDFHGSVFEFARNNAIDARNFFAATTPPLNLHQFGGSIGGPIIKDKTHFFASWEETREAYGSSVISTVPTLAERQGDFSAFKSVVYDPASLSGGKKQPFAGNQIPLNRLDPVALKAEA